MPSSALSSGITISPSSHDLIQNHPCQPNRICNDRGETGRRSADVLLPGEPYGRNDRRGNHQCRSKPVCHAFLLFHHLGPFLFLASDSAPHFAHFSPPLLDPWGLATS